MENNNDRRVDHDDNNEFIDDYSYHKESGGCLGMLIGFGVIVTALLAWGIYEILI